MAGEWQDYRDAVEEIKKEDRRRWGYGQPPLRVRIFKSLYWIGCIAFYIGIVVYFFVAYGAKGGLYFLLTTLFTLVVIPGICMLISRRK